MSALRGRRRLPAPAFPRSVASALVGHPADQRGGCCRVPFPPCRPPPLRGRIADPQTGAGLFLMRCSPRQGGCRPRARRVLPASGRHSLCAPALVALLSSVMDLPEGCLAYGLFLASLRGPGNGCRPTLVAGPPPCSFGLFVCRPFCRPQSWRFRCCRPLFWCRPPAGVG